MTDKKELEKRDELEKEYMEKNPKVLDVVLAKERTLLSRERTAISLGQLALGVAVFGFAVIRFFAGDAGQEWFFAVGAGAILLSGYLTFHAWHEYKHFQMELDHLHSKRGHLDSIYVEGFE
jgi:uncharacterized membrane protein YidH (DUF202 family)